MCVAHLSKQHMKGVVEGLVLHHFSFIFLLESIYGAQANREQLFSPLCNIKVTRPAKRLTLAPAQSSWPVPSGLALCSPAGRCPAAPSTRAIAMNADVTNKTPELAWLEPREMAFANEPSC